MVGCPRFASASPDVSRCMRRKGCEIRRALIGQGEKIDVLKREQRIASGI